MEPHDEEHGLARVHLVNPLWDASGGSDWRTIDTWRLLRPHADVRMWSEYSPAPAFAHYPVERLRPWWLRFPRAGTLVFVGIYFRIGHWTRLASFERVVLIYNTDQPDRLAKYVERLERAGHRVDIIYTSRALRRRHRGRGRVLESPIDVQRFRPWRIVRPARPFTVGRLSRDIRSKHHEDDPRLWRALAQAGCRVRLMGATCLGREIGDVPNIEVLPAGAEDPAAFLRSLDCFVYRTSAQWFEAYGRVVIEAMATGLPIVAGRRGGYTDHLRDRVNAMVIGDSDEAIERVMELRADVVAAMRLGSAARRDAVALNAEELPRRTVALLTARGAAAERITEAEAVTT
ncbi:MAG: glycosyltransferase [Pseudomonadota bacterium]|nr:glycosyltransferase [Pseudomonadota bacterium]